MHIDQFNIPAIIIAPILTYVFNCSINSNKFSKVLEVAKVIPVYKKGDKHDTNTYKPISILPVISLILEKHVSEKNKIY